MAGLLGLGVLAMRSVSARAMPSLRDCIRALEVVPWEEEAAAAALLLPSLLLGAAYAFPHAEWGLAALSVLLPLVPAPATAAYAFSLRLSSVGIRAKPSALGARLWATESAIPPIM